MYTDVMNYVNNCPQRAIVEGTGRKQKPLLQPIFTELPFQIVGVDIMELATCYCPRKSICNSISRTINKIAFSFSHSRPESRMHCPFTS